MKTPREILLARYQTAEPKLDAVRHAVVLELSAKTQRSEDAKISETSGGFAALRLCVKKLFRELIWPCRRTWAGLAAVWLAIALFHLSHRELRQPALAQTAPSPGETRLAWLEQRRVLDELIGPRPAAPAIAPPRRQNHQPRSERRTAVMA